MQEQKAAAQPERGGLPVKTLEGEVVPQLRGVVLQVSAAPSNHKTTTWWELPAKHRGQLPHPVVRCCGDPVTGLQGMVRSQFCGMDLQTSTAANRTASAISQIYT